MELCECKTLLGNAPELVINYRLLNIYATCYYTDSKAEQIESQRTTNSSPYLNTGKLNYQLNHFCDLTFFTQKSV